MERLREFVEGQHRGVLEVLALTGVTIEEEIELSCGVSLIPFSSVPESQMSEWFSPAGTSALVDPMHNMFVPTPTAALVSSDEDSVELVEEWPDPSDDSAYSSKQKLFWQISQCLTLIGPSSPTPVAQWSQLRSPEQVPMLGAGQGWGHSIQEAYPLATTVLPNGEDIRKLVERYLDLDTTLRNKLAISIQRLNLALRRHDVVDKAIELGVALEALLVADRDADAQVSYLLRVRGAWLGGGTLEERRERRKLLKQVYDLRSRAVHSGTLNRQQAGEILHEGSVLCANLIHRVIEQGSMPSWDDLILTPDPWQP